tara:strand:+ start:1731 stop:1967 length:237 start_codon:yes stop_codon:yes gene_type:complete
MDKDETFDMKYSLIINDIIQNIQFEYEDYPEKYSITELKIDKIYSELYNLIKESSKDYKDIIEDVSSDDEGYYLNLFN